MAKKKTSGNGETKLIAPVFEIHPDLLEKIENGLNSIERTLDNLLKEKKPNV